MARHVRRLVDSARRTALRRRPRRPIELSPKSGPSEPRVSDCWIARNLFRFVARSTYAAFFVAPDTANTSGISLSAASSAGAVGATGLVVTGATGSSVPIERTGLGNTEATGSVTTETTGVGTDGGAGKVAADATRFPTRLVRGVRRLVPEPTGLVRELTRLRRDTTRFLRKATRFVRAPTRLPRLETRLRIPEFRFAFLLLALRILLPFSNSGAANGPA